MKNITLSYSEYASVADLPQKERELVEAAIKAAESAYAPFSNFRVGAALLTEKGDILSASNQESEVLPSCMCAERSLLYYYQSRLAGERISDMAIFSPDSTKAISPCGSCRQVLLDTEKRQGSKIRLIFAGSKGGVIVGSAEGLLPLSFSL